MKSFDQFSDSNKNKKNNQFTILKDDSTDGHGGYGIGSISLENMSPVLIDPAEETAYVEMDCMHARSKVERGIKFLKDRTEVPNAKLYWIVWVTVTRNENGPYYYGVTGCELLVDREIRRGYKSMPEHVNHMDKSLKGKVIVEHMDEKSQNLLEDFLKTHSAEMWENSSDELKQAFTSEK